MTVRSLALLYVGRDYGVALLDMKLAGLRESTTRHAKLSQYIEAVEQELIQAMPPIRDYYPMDLAFEDEAGRKYVVRLYMNEGIIWYALFLCPKNSLRGVLRRLSQQGWRLVVSLEKKTVKTQSEPGVQ